MVSSLHNHFFSYYRYSPLPIDGGKFSPITQGDSLIWLFKSFRGGRITDFSIHPNQSPMRFSHLSHNSPWFRPLFSTKYGHLFQPCFLQRSDPRITVFANPDLRPRLIQWPLLILEAKFWAPGSHTIHLRWKIPLLKKKVAFPSKESQFSELLSV